MIDTKSKSVNLTTCSTAFQAELIKGRLEDAGIKCALSGEKFSTIYSITEAPLVSVGIDVLEKDYDRAVEILSQVINEEELPIDELSQEVK